MQAATHTFKTATGGQVSIGIEIFRMSGVEAVDLHDLDASLFDAGGWRIEGFLDGRLCGVEFVHNGSREYLDNDAEQIARGFVSPTHAIDHLHADSVCELREQKSIGLRRSGKSYLVQCRASVQIRRP